VTFYLKSIDSLMVKHFGELREAFVAADKNGNGRLKKNEFTSFLRSKLPGKLSFPPLILLLLFPS